MSDGFVLNESPDVMALRLKILSLAAENERLRNTVSYQLGNVVLRARSWRGIAALPSEFSRLLRVSRHKRGRFQGQIPPLAFEERIRRIVTRAFDLSADEIVAVADAETDSVKTQAVVLAEISAIIKPVDAEKALILARRAVEVDPSPYRLAWLAALLFDEGAIEEPRRIYARLAKHREVLSQTSKRRSAMADGMVRVRDQKLFVPQRSNKSIVTTPRRLTYVAASSFPYHTTGYTSRTQALIKALAGQGWSVDAVTRPGYPHDRNDIHNMPKDMTQEVDGVSYTVLAGPPAANTPFDRYCADASASLLRHIRKSRPAIVQAASNHVNATPALIAARRAGLPFVYEVRGLWELTHAAREPRFEESERFIWQRQQETLVASEADLVLTISEGLKSELVRRGVDEAKISVTPNCVDPNVFAPRRRDKRLAEELHLDHRHVFGFLGSMTGYEGLIDLVRALAVLRDEGLDACALLVGDGPAAQEVREAARSLGVWDRVIMPGRVPHSDAPRWYSLMDVAIYPRRPSQVTELVPPLKPLEAMAIGLPVIASNVSAIREMVRDRETGFLFQPGNVADLVATMKEVIDSPKTARAVAKQARRDIHERFTWAGAARNMEGAYKCLNAGRTTC